MSLSSHTPTLCMKRCALVVMGLLVIGGSGTAQAQQQRATPVKVVKAMSAPLFEELPLSGSVTTPRLSRLSPQVAGLVASISVDEGDEVKQGDVLLALDRDIAQLDYNRSQAQVKEAEIRLKEAMRQRDEAAGLVSRKHIPATDYAAALATVDMDGAALERLKQAMQKQKEMLRRHTVKAPFDGVITQKRVEVGEWVGTDSALFELVEMRILRVHVPVPQYYFNDVQLGTPVTMTFDAYPERHFSARVTMKVPMSNESARTFPVRIDLNNRDRLIAPGMSARVVFHLNDPSAGEALLLPQDAIVRKPDGSESVWVLQKQGAALKAKPVIIQTGRSYRESIEITGGPVQAGDQVVIRGNEMLQPGQLVEIKDELELKL